MHNGQFTSIAQVINHYAAIPGNNPNLDPRLRRPGNNVQVLNLTPQDRLDIEAFLLTLSGNAVYLEPKWSNPFSASGTITLVNVPPGLGPTPSPTPAPLAARSLNISSRLGAGTADQAVIGGFIISGTTPKSVLIRGLGPALGNFGLTGFLNDPMLELRGADGTLLAQNDNWKDNQQGLIEATPYAPADNRESVIIASLAPGAYTAVLSGKNQTTGLALVEIYDLDQAIDTQLANISTRGSVGAQNNVMIGGFILGGENGTTRVAVRGLGPSLAQFSLSPLLADPIGGLPGLGDRRGRVGEARAG